MAQTRYEGCLDRVFDVVVVGGGYAGFAAAMRLRRQERSVLLIEPWGDLLWESGRAFAWDAGDRDEPSWREFVDDVASRGGAADGWIDGAIAEVAATRQVMDAGLDILYYAHPVAVEREDEMVSGLIVATKSGLCRVAGRQWVDATEDGAVLRMADASIRPRPAARREATLYLQREEWPEEEVLLRTAWPSERAARVAMEDDEGVRPAVLRGLRGLQGAAREAVMSHCSVEAYPIYESAAGGVSDLANVAAAAPALAREAVVSLADRFALGIAAADRLNGLTVHETSADVLRRPLPTVAPVRRIEADVLVAGAGTGGALAAIASGRAGARTLCVEPMSFAGGIGSGGGIHSYYYGVTGGLQQEIDRTIKTLMQGLGRPLSGGPFNPDAKKIVLEDEMAKAGVRFMPQTLVYGVETLDGKITRAFAASPEGPIEIVAQAWIDATGDGDLCAMAGASFTMGREGDGLPHAYSQSSGQLRRREHDGLTMAIVNFDAGWCDPTDVEDFTRARLVGIAQYLKDAYENLDRPTYIAPAIGLRQARQVETDYVLTLADQIERRRFPDAIGFTGCHYDNHAVDYEFESDEALFWIWLNRNWRTPFACELSYRMLLPQGLSNVWIACRALGVSQDAHHSCRMQRDMQRIGEAAGDAAALCVKRGVDARDVPFEELREMLHATGAITLEHADAPPVFGNPWGHSTAESSWFENAVSDAALAEDLAALDRGEPGEAIWRLYRAGDRVREQVVSRLTHDRPMTSWLAAGVCAMWGDPQAEPRLLAAIDSRENGFEDVPEDKAPGRNNRVVQNWAVAVGLLRRCGASDSLPALERLASDTDLLLNARTSIALTIERLAQRGVINDVDRAVAVLDQLTATDPADAYVHPQRPVNIGPQARPAGRDTREDHLWQLHLAAARARAALDRPMHDAARAYLTDRRSLVRRAFERLAEAVQPVAVN